MEREPLPPFLKEVRGHYQLFAGVEGIACHGVYEESLSFTSSLTSFPSAFPPSLAMTDFIIFPRSFRDEAWVSLIVSSMIPNISSRLKGSGKKDFNIWISVLSFSTT